MALPTILERILETKAAEVRVRSGARAASELSAEVAGMPPPRGFAASLQQQAACGPAIIAEIKRASPSAGLIRADFQPTGIAQAYAKAGAACLSVLTDETYFRGSDKHLEEALAACDLPVLRKEFIIDEWQVLETRVLGADCILLSAAALEDGRLDELHGAARGCGLDVLVEVHDEAEMEAALKLGDCLIGVNNRDLKRMVTDLSTTERLAPLLRDGKTLISESGISKPEPSARYLT